MLLVPNSLFTLKKRTTSGMSTVYLIMREPMPANMKMPFVTAIYFMHKVGRGPVYTIAVFRVYIMA